MKHYSAINGWIGWMGWVWKSLDKVKYSAPYSANNYNYTVN